MPPKRTTEVVVETEGKRQRMDNPELIESEAGTNSGQAMSLSANLIETLVSRVAMR